MSYENPVDHRAMALDTYRNGFYEKALREAVRGDSIVLDAGAGIGILGLMAAKLGAAKVFLVEPSTDIEAARLIASENGLLDRVCFMPERVEKVSIDEPVDIITSVFTGNFLLEEDLLPSLFTARDRFLKPGGTLIPSAGRMLVCPVALPETYRRQVDCWNEAAFIDQGSMRQFAVNQVHYGDYSGEDLTCLAEAQLIVELDFYTVSSPACDAALQFRVSNAGQCHGLLGWFDIDFGHDWLSTSPAAPATHWSQAFLPLDRPVTLSAGDNVSLRVKRPEFGEWSWVVNINGAEQKHSTFLSRPVTPDRLQRASADYRPRRGERGEVLGAMLELMGGTNTSREIATLLWRQYPGFFVSEQAAMRFVIDRVRLLADK